MGSDFDMKDADRLRDRAIRLFALALKAQENGNGQFADQLTQMANEVLAHAEEIERRDGEKPQIAAERFARAPT
jgi:hypothetical protein